MPTRRRRRTPAMFADESARKVGWPAVVDGVCGRCSEPVLKGERIIPRGDGWMHAFHASGFDDE